MIILVLHVCYNTATVCRIVDKLSNTKQLVYVLSCQVQDMIVMILMKDVMGRLVIPSVSLIQASAQCGIFFYP